MQVGILSYWLDLLCCISHMNEASQARLWLDVSRIQSLLQGSWLGKEGDCSLRLFPELDVERCL